MVFVFVRGGSKEGGDQGGKELEVAFVVDFAAVGFGDKGTEQVPWNLGGCNIRASLSNRVDPRVDDKCAAFVLGFVS